MHSCTWSALDEQLSTFPKTEMAGGLKWNVPLISTMVVEYAACLRRVLCLWPSRVQIVMSRQQGPPFRHCWPA